MVTYRKCKNTSLYVSLCAFYYNYSTLVGNNNSEPILLRLRPRWYVKNCSTFAKAMQCDVMNPLVRNYETSKMTMSLPNGVYRQIEIQQATERLNLYSSEYDLHTSMHRKITRNHNIATVIDSFT